MSRNLWAGKCVWICGNLTKWTIVSFKLALVHLVAKLMSGAEYMLMLKPHNTMVQLKAAVARRIGLPAHLQSIYSACPDGWYRMDATTLLEMGVCDGSTVHVCWD